MANQFVRAARLSTHRFPSKAEETAALIYRDHQHLTDDPNGYFQAIYLWAEGYKTVKQEHSKLSVVPFA